MKRVLTTALMLVTMLTASAQGEWSKTVTEADELKEQEATECYMFTVPQMGKFVMWGWNEYQFRLISTECQFNINSGYAQFAGAYSGVTAFVGLYDDNNKLVEKFKMWLDKEDNRANQFVKTRDAGGMMNPVGQKKKVKKIFKHLQGGKGYVRIVCERFQHSDFDIKILPFTE